MIDQKHLDEIKERMEKSTEGQWELDRNSDDNDFVTDIWFNGEDDGHAEIHGNSIIQSVIDAIFIANARRDVAALVAEVERLREALCKIADNTEFSFNSQRKMMKIAMEALGLLGGEK